MLKRMLPLLGALLAVGVLAVAPSAATGDASSTARTAGIGPGSGCDDHYPPHSSWGHGWYGHDRHGGYWRGWGDGQGYFGGRSWDPNCDALHPGKVDHVMVAVEQVRGSRCRPMFRSGHFGPRRDCSRSHWFRAHGTQRWRHEIWHALRQGRYRLHRRAVDAAGNRERDHMRRIRVR